MSGTQPLRQSCNDAVGIFLVIIDVWRDPQAAKTRCDVDAVACKTLD
jgi:hypothetical protein